MRVAKRQKSTKITLRGLFPGAKVVRGPDWDWANQDGKSTKSGVAAAISNSNFGGRYQLPNINFANWFNSSNYTYEILKCLVDLIVYK